MPKPDTASTTGGNFPLIREILPTLLKMQSTLEKYLSVLQSNVPQQLLFKESASGRVFVHVAATQCIASAIDFGRESPTPELLPTFSLREEYVSCTLCLLEDRTKQHVYKNALRFTDLTSSLLHASGRFSGVHMTRLRQDYVTALKLTRTRYIELLPEESKVFVDLADEYALLLHELLVEIGSYRAWPAPKLPASEQVYFCLDAVSYATLFENTKVAAYVSSYFHLSPYLVSHYRGVQTYRLPKAMVLTLAGVGSVVPAPLTVEEVECLLAFKKDGLSFPEAALTSTSV